MILIGTMNITRTRSVGDFHCPTCGSIREYTLKSRRPFLTLYFIPTVPIGGQEWFVRCQGCKSHWDPAVLQMDAAAHQSAREAQFGGEAFRAAVLVAQHGEAFGEETIEELLAIAQRLLGEPITRDDLGRLCSSATQNRVSPINYVRSVSPGWTTDQRQLALGAIFVAATAEGEPDPAKLNLLASLRDAMDLTDQEYQQAIETAIAWEK
jgi:hypothetical protein